MTQAQAINNLYWWPKYLTNGEMKEEMCPEQIKDYFNGCLVFSSREDALKEADRIYQAYEWTEYGIQFLPKYEKIFPE